MNFKQAILVMMCCVVGVGAGDGYMRRMQAEEADAKAKAGVAVGAGEVVPTPAPGPSVRPSAMFYRVGGPTAEPSVVWQHKDMKIMYVGIYGYSSIPAIKNGELQLCLPALHYTSTAVPLVVYTITGASVLTRGLLDDVLAYHKIRQLSEDDVQAYLRFITQTGSNLCGLHAGLRAYYKGGGIMTTQPPFDGFVQMALSDYSDVKFYDRTGRATNRMGGGAEADPDSDDEMQVVAVRYVPRWFFSE